MTKRIDAVAVEVFWNRLLSVVNEQQTALMRSAFSTIVRETQDLACGVFDTSGNMVAQSVTGTPGHINAMATGVRHFLASFPPESLDPGDVLVTNDPWLTAGQINDITVVSPVFLDGDIVGYFANTCHAPDIGGRLLSAEASEVYEEGLRLPMMKLFVAGEPNEPLFELVRANVRTPKETTGDLYAQASANEVGAISLVKLLREFSLGSLDRMSEEILARSENALRSAIADLPDGTYTNRTMADGFEDESIELVVSATISGDEIELDFTGSSAQSTRGINVVLNYTHAYASFAIKAAISPDVPHNHGSFRPVSVTAPKGSILNCEQPAPVASRHIIGHFIPGLIFGALAKTGALERTMASGADPIWISVWRGRRVDDRDPFTFTLFQCGGTGARSEKDGLNTTGFPSGVAGVPAEVMEVLTPLVQLRKRLRTDSGGPGRHRGGLGQESTITCRTDEAWSVSIMGDRTRFPADGVDGGGSGRTGSIRDEDGRELRTKTLLRLDPRASIDLDLPGGGGHGDPFERPPEEVLQDVAHGYVSREEAAASYGVVVSYRGEETDRVRLPRDYEIDHEATRRRRSGVTADDT